jgi:uncharacterized membrane protein
MPIRMPAAWGFEQISHATQARPTAAPDQYWPNAGTISHVSVRRIGVSDLRYALRRGFEDFGALRTDVAFLCIFYPVIGLMLARAVVGTGFLPLLFPLASGFALVGPVAAIGLNEMSRRRELGMEVGWTSVFEVFRSPALGRILMLAAGMMILFLAWLTAAQIIYAQTLGTTYAQPYGDAQPPDFDQFMRDVFTTGAGWAMMLTGCGVGFLFAVTAFAISVVSFPMLLDLNVSLETAVGTSLRAVSANPVTMGVWGLMIAVALVVASIPALLGLVIVLPVLGHATWHLYRRVVQV